MFFARTQPVQVLRGVVQRVMQLKNACGEISHTISRQL
jgi:hypothetical protein